MQTAFPQATLAALLLSGCAATHSTLTDDQVAAAPDLPELAVPHRTDLVVERSVAVAAPPALVYDLLADVARWPDWDPAVTKTIAHAGRPLQAGDRFFQNPQGFEAEAVVLDAVPGKLLRWRGEGDGIVGVHSYRLVPTAEGGTLVYDREEFSAWWLRLVGWATDAGVGDGFETTLAALARKAEGVEPVQRLNAR